MHVPKRKCCANVEVVKGYRLNIAGDFDNTTGDFHRITCEFDNITDDFGRITGNFDNITYHFGKII